METLKAIKHLPIVSELPEQEQVNYEDILSEDEKLQAIAHAIKAAKEKYRFQKERAGIPKKQIEAEIEAINWEDGRIHFQEVLRAANRRKHWEKEDLDYREECKQRELAEKRRLLTEWNYKKFYNEIRKYFFEKHGDFIYNDSNSAYIKAVCFFLSRDPRFETELGFSFSKGLMIVGTAGLGKTEVLNSVSKNPVRPIAVYSIIDITEKVQSEGHIQVPTNRLTLLDDVGTETPTVTYYGTKISWFKDFIESYYSDKLPFSNLIITTNCGGDEIQEKYGYRVRSRMREMFNVIQLSGEDLRK